MKGRRSGIESHCISFNVHLSCRLCEMKGERRGTWNFGCLRLHALEIVGYDLYRWEISNSEWEVEEEEESSPMRRTK